MPALIDRTIGQVQTPDGARADFPCTLLTPDAAATIRAYFTWTLSHQLEPELYCSTCYNGSRDDKALYNINDLEIQIICKCQIRAFFGVTPKPAMVEACKTLPLAEGDTVGAVALSDDIARLMRRYDKTVLKPYGLKEALRCNACYEIHGPDEDGCEAHVLTNSILIRCRCSRRTHSGLTI